MRMNIGVQLALSGCAYNNVGYVKSSCRDEEGTQEVCRSFVKDLLWYEKAV